jgi:hypothetical protein
VPDDITLAGGLFGVLCVIAIKAIIINSKTIPPHTNRIIFLSIYLYKNDFSQKPFSNYYLLYYGLYYLFLPD